MGTPMPNIWVANPAGAQKIPNNLHQMVLFHQKPKKYTIKIVRYNDPKCPKRFKKKHTFYECHL